MRFGQTLRPRFEMVLLALAAVALPALGGLIARRMWVSTPDPWLED